jgi:hypothetical protein
MVSSIHPLCRRERRYKSAAHRLLTFRGIHTKKTPSTLNVHLHIIAAMHHRHLSGAYASLKKFGSADASADGPFAYSPLSRRDFEIL